jgi:uncharacterized protein (TIGR00288 family)
MEAKDDDNKKKIALLIDCDNISFKCVEKIIEEIEAFGDIIIKRAYGNWRNDSLKNWLTKLMELSIKPIQQIDYTKGKNATDMAIAIDAMKLLYEKKLDAFAIVSSDSDFTPLAMTLQEEGKKVYGFGYETSPIALQRACSIFTNITPFIKEEKALESQTKEKPAKKLNSKDLTQRVIDIFVSLSPDNTQVTFEKLNRSLKDNGIDYAKCGFKQFKVFLDSLNLFNIIINENHQGFAFLKQIRTDFQHVDVKDDTVLMNNVLESFNALSQDNQPVLSSTLYNVLGLKYNFKYKDYGYSSFKAFIEQVKFLKLVFEENQWYIYKT